MTRWLACYIVAVPAALLAFAVLSLLLHHPPAHHPPAQRVTRLPTASAMATHDASDSARITSAGFTSAPA